MFGGLETKVVLSCHFTKKNHVLMVSERRKERGRNKSDFKMGRYIVTSFSHKGLTVTTKLTDPLSLFHCLDNEYVNPKHLAKNVWM